MGLQTRLGPRVHGVASQIIQLEPRATYTHCYGHVLNLAARDTIQKKQFHRIKTEVAPDTPGFHTSCSTRWTVTASSLQSVLDNYTVLQELWEEAVEIVSDSEARARIVGVSAAMATFDCLGLWTTSAPAY